MDGDLKCNRLVCRKALTDKAVVTTCSHIFCVECANELFNASQLCPACETTLSEPDDVVICSLHPTNDYKTSVLSGLSPSIVLEICSRAISFWQYQTHQENSFQQAVVRNVNDMNTQLQKQLENVIREANGEINILNNKVSELEHDLELERRKVRDLQDASRERDKEYQKLKHQHDKIKRKALLAPNTVGQDNSACLGGPHPDRRATTDHQAHSRTFGANLGNASNFGTIVGGMDANGIQRTPIVNRTAGPLLAQQSTAWPQKQLGQASVSRTTSRRPNFGQVDQSGTTSDRSESANEVENLLLNQSRFDPARRAGQAGWAAASGSRPNQRMFAPTTNKRVQNGFKPAR